MMVPNQHMKQTTKRIKSKTHTHTYTATLSWAFCIVLHV